MAGQSSASGDQGGSSAKPLRKFLALWGQPLFYYGIFVLAGAVWLWWRQPRVGDSPPQKEKKHTMKLDDIVWQSTNSDFEVPARPVGLWTPVGLYIQGPRRIFLTVGPDQKWNYAPSSRCGPDGDLGSMIATQYCTMPSAPVGALIAKIGGSNAGQTDGKLYLVGSYSVIDVDAAVRGPLFLTINDDVSSYANNTGSIKVTLKIDGTTNNPPPAAGAPPSPPVGASASPKP